MTVETSLIVNFGNVDIDNSIVLFQLDSNLNDTTSFNPGDDIYLFCQVSNDVEITDIVATHGDVRFFGNRSATNTDYIDFLSRDETPENNIGYYSPRVTSTSFLGRSGLVTYLQQANGSLSLHGNEAQTPYKLKVNYSVDYLSYKLSTPNVSLAEGESYPITVVLYVSKKGVDDGCSGSQRTW